MCAIFGFNNIKLSSKTTEHIYLYLAMHSVIEGSSQFGRDAAGYELYANGEKIPESRLPKPTRFLPETKLGENLSGRVWDSFVHNVKYVIDTYKSLELSCIGNFRAEPTTEWRRNMTMIDVQPYSNVNPDSQYPHYISGYEATRRETVSIVHNGTIANDDDLIDLLRLDRMSIGIDSQVIPFVIGDSRLDINDMVGSIAVAAFIHKDVVKKQPSRMMLAKNYRPLSVAFFPDLKGHIFASYREHLLGSSVMCQEVDFPPNSILTLHTDGSVSRESGAFFDSPDERTTRQRARKSAAVILSGGLDSTTAATAICTMIEGLDELHLLHFHYGCRAETRETLAVQEIQVALADMFPHIKVSLATIDLDFLHQLGGNALVDDSIPITEGKTGVEFAHEWVPYRNGVMASLAAAYCDRWGIGYITLGTNLEEAGAYPDNGKEFYDLLGQATKLGSKVCPEIINPLEKLMKHEIVSLALKIKAPIHLSWSCYAGGKHHCGKCGPCTMRKTAFAMNDTPDKIKYEN